MQRVRACCCSGIVEGAALLLCQFLVQSICRPQRLAVVVDVVQRVLTAFLRRVCNWVDKLGVERFSGDSGAILTPYACARFLAPTAAKIARACKPCAWIWFWWGGAAIKNTPRLIIRKKNRLSLHPRRGIHRPRYPRTPYNLTTFLACRKSFVAECVGVMVAVVTAIGVTISPRHTDKNTDKSNTPTAWRCRRFVLAVILLSYGEAVDVVTAAKCVNASAAVLASGGGVYSAGV